MMSFNADAAVAEQEMRAVIFILLAFAHIDGDFDARERAFIRDFTDRLVERRADELARRRRRRAPRRRRRAGRRTSTR